MAAFLDWAAPQAENRQPYLLRRAKEIELQKGLDAIRVLFLLHSTPPMITQKNFRKRNRHPSARIAKKGPPPRAGRDNPEARQLLRERPNFSPRDIGKRPQQRRILPTAGAERARS